MTINEIWRLRERIAGCFDPERRIAESHIVEMSPDGRYQMVVDEYRDPTHESERIVEVVVQEAATGEQVARFLCDDDRLYHAWVRSQGRDYLVCPETLEGAQTVVDIEGRRIAGFWSEEDAFIWATFHPSPDGTRLAVVGCYWACPYEVVVYDFRRPLDLPLPIVQRFELPGGLKFGAWISSDAFRLVPDEFVSQDKVVAPQTVVLRPLESL